MLGERNLSSQNFGVIPQGDRSPNIIPFPPAALRRSENLAPEASGYTDQHMPANWFPLQTCLYMV